MAGPLDGLHQCTVALALFFLCRGFLDGGFLGGDGLFDGGLLDSHFLLDGYSLGGDGLLHGSLLHSGLLGHGSGGFLGCGLLGGGFIVALAVHGGDAGAGGAGHEDALLEDLGGAGADFREGADDLVGLEFHLAAGVAHMGDFTVGLDLVAGIDGSFELHHVAGAEEAFVAVLFD